MNKLMLAVAAAIVLPAAAFAQGAPAPTAPAAAGHAGHDMQSMSCKDMMATGHHAGHQASGAGGQADHSKMDHSKMDHSKMASCSGAEKTGASQAADPHANHKK